jgi:hypothetical protein
MQEKELKTYIEKSFKFCKSEDIGKEFTQLKTYIKFLSDKKEEFTLKVVTGKKTYPQLKAFYSARDQLLPQYNKYLMETGNNEFDGETAQYSESGFEDVMKAIMGLVRKKTLEEAIIFVKNNIRKHPLFKGVSEKELIELDQKSIVLKSKADATKEEMMEGLDKLDKWAMNKGFSLIISRELMDLIK